MRKVVMYCDRCKKEFEKWNHKRNELIGVGEIIYDNDDPYWDNQKDLCESCYDELEKWWNFDSQAESEVEEKAMKQEPCEDIAKAFQFGMALGFGEKHDEMDKVINEIKKVITPQPKTGHCKECKYFEYCKRWGDGCKTKEDGYCFMFEPQESEVEK